MTLNNMVNNWSTEIESFNINFVHISGKANILADTLSRLIDTDPDLKQQQELEGHEFGIYCFETLPKVRGSVHHKKVSGDEFDICEIQITYNNPKIWHYQLNCHWRRKNLFPYRCRIQKFGNFMTRSKKGMYHEFYLVKSNVLFRFIVGNGHKFEARVISDLLVDVLLHLCHNQSGHNGYHRTYAAINHLYYWKGMRAHIFPLLQKLQGLCITKG